MSSQRQHFFLPRSLAALEIVSWKRNSSSSPREIYPQQIQRLASVSVPGMGTCRDHSILHPEFTTENTLHLENVHVIFKKLRSVSFLLMPAATDSLDFTCPQFLSFFRFYSFLNSLSNVLIMSSECLTWSLSRL